MQVPALHANAPAVPPAGGSAPAAGGLQGVDWLLQHMGEAFCRLDRDLRIVQANAAAAAMLGCRARPQAGQQPAGQWLADLWPGALQGRLREALAGGLPFTAEEHHEPSQRWFEVRGFPVDGGLAVFMRHIGTPRRGERPEQAGAGGPQRLEALRQALAGARAQSERLLGLSRWAVDIGRRVGCHPGRNGLLQQLVDDVRLQMGAHQAALSLHEGRSWQPALKAVSLSAKYAAWRDAGRLPVHAGIASLALEHGTPMLMTQQQLESHPRWAAGEAPAAGLPPLRGWLAAPMFGRDGRTIGLLQLSDRYEGDFDEQDLAVAQQMAQLIAAAIETDAALGRAAGAGGACARPAARADGAGAAP
jgi:GAF domain-containing protein